MADQTKTEGNRHTQARQLLWSCSVVAAVTCSTFTAEGNGQSAPNFASAAAPVRSPPTAGDSAPTTALAICLELADALRIEAPLRPFADDACRHAPTFRRQLARIRLAPELVVRVEVWRSHWSQTELASTALRREKGHLRSAAIQVRIDDPGRVIELIAHEFEHVLEQLDGIDLARWAGQSGVSRRGPVAAGLLETARARAVGRLVAAEYAARSAGSGGGR